MLLQGLADLEPRTPNIVLTFLLTGAMIALYIYFGFNFFFKGRRSNSDAQRSYYQGLGFFIITVAISEAMYLADYISRVLYEERIFRTIGDWEAALGIQTDSVFAQDYFIYIFMLLSFGLIFLAIPLEKYLLGRKHKPLTWAAALSLPLPLLARFLELRIPVWTGNPIEEYGSNYMLTSIVWFVNLGIIIITLLILFSLYLKMGVKAPPGSKLRRKSKQIVLGLFIWIFAILMTSSVLSEVWENGNEWLNMIDAGLTLGVIYYILPFVIPTLLLSSLGLISNGFNRRYS